MWSPQLWLLAFAVLAMHHVVSATHHPHAEASVAVDTTTAYAAAVPREQLAGEPDPGAFGARLLPCVAVLFSVAGLVFTTRRPGVMLHPGRDSAMQCRADPPWRRSRPLGPSGRRLLTSFCILRI